MSHLKPSAAEQGSSAYGVHAQTLPPEGRQSQNYKMGPRIHTRRAHLAMLLAEKVWGKWIAFTWTIIYGVFAAWRSEFVSSKLQDQFQIPAMLAHVPLFWGVVVLALIIVAWAFEASFRAHRRIVPITADPTPKPDWALRDLFLHIDPYQLDDQKAEAWKAIGREVIDQLSIGRLPAWGRPQPYGGTRHGPLGRAPNRTALRASGW